MVFLVPRGYVQWQIQDLILRGRDFVKCMYERFQLVKINDVESDLQPVSVWCFTIIYFRPVAFSNIYK